MEVTCCTVTKLYTRDFRFLSWCRWDLHSSGLSQCRVVIHADVLGQLIFNSQEISNSKTVHISKLHYHRNVCLVKKKKKITAAATIVMIIISQHVMHAKIWNWSTKFKLNSMEEKDCMYQFIGPSFLHSAEISSQDTVSTV